MSDLDILRCVGGIIGKAILDESHIHKSGWPLSGTGGSSKPCLGGGGAYVRHERPHELHRVQTHGELRIIIWFAIQLVSIMTSVSL